MCLLCSGHINLEGHYLHTSASRAFDHQGIYMATLAEVLQRILSLDQHIIIEERRKNANANKDMPKINLCHMQVRYIILWHCGNFVDMFSHESCFGIILKFSDVILITKTLARKLLRPFFFSTYTSQTLDQEENTHLAWLPM